MNASTPPAEEVPTFHPVEESPTLVSPTNTNKTSSLLTLTLHDDMMNDDSMSTSDAPIEDVPTTPPSTTTTSGYNNIYINIYFPLNPSNNDGDYNDDHPASNDVTIVVDIIGHDVNHSRLTAHRQINRTPDHVNSDCYDYGVDFY